MTCSFRLTILIRTQEIYTTSYTTNLIQSCLKNSKKRNEMHTDKKYKESKTKKSWNEGLRRLMSSRGFSDEDCNNRGNTAFHSSEIFFPLIHFVNMNVYHIFGTVSVTVRFLPPFSICFALFAILVSLLFQTLLSRFVCHLFRFSVLFYVMVHVFK